MPNRPEELFAGTAPYYARYRPGYPPELFTALAARFSLATGRVLDLGCGTGQISLALAPRAAAVVGVDPSAEMLAEAAALAEQRGLANVEFRLGDSATLGDLGLGAFDLVTMGASFHWMDRDATLALLDRMVTARGGVVVAGGGTPAVEPPWEPVIREVRAAWLGPQRRAGSGTYSHPKERHETVLARSAFPVVERLEFHQRVERTLDMLVGLQFSYSYSAPALLGADRPGFEQDLRRRLAEVQPDGVFAEDIRTEVLVATRGSGAAPHE
jgi:SAM-dependent methyltransferase